MVLSSSRSPSRFTGSNPARWICDAERFFSVYAIYEEERFPYVVEYFDDEPFSWFNSWYRGPEHLTWKSFTTAMLHRFHTTTTSNNGSPSPPSLTAKQPPLSPVQPSSLPCHETPITTTSSLGRVASPPTPTPSPKQLPLGSIKPQGAIFTTKTSIPVLYPFILLDGHASLENRDSKLNDVVDQNAIGRREWRPPWLPPTTTGTIKPSLPTTLLPPIPTTPSHHEAFAPPYAAVDMPPPPTNTTDNIANYNIFNNINVGYETLFGTLQPIDNVSFAKDGHYVIRLHVKRIKGWKPPWRFVSTSPNNVGRTEWRPPWRPVKSAPNATGRVEWRPPWRHNSVLEDKDVFEGGSIDTINNTSRDINY